VKTKAKSVQWYLDLIKKKNPSFVDSGLSGGFPDWIYKYILRHNITPAGRVHDWHYCSRCHAEEWSTPEARKFADKALRQHARELLPWWLNIAPLVLYRGVRLFGSSSFNRCDPTVGTRCDHNMLKPAWMKTNI